MSFAVQEQLLFLQSDGMGIIHQKKSVRRTPHEVDSQINVSINLRVYFYQ